MQVISVIESLPDQPVFNIRHFVLRKNEKRNDKLRAKAKTYFLDLATANGAIESEVDNLLNLGVYTRTDGYILTYTELGVKKKDK